MVRAIRLAIPFLLCLASFCLSPICAQQLATETPPRHDLADDPEHGIHWAADFETARTRALELDRPILLAYVVPRNASTNVGEP